MERITEHMLQMRVDHLNKITNSPMTPYSRDERGHFQPHLANVGNYHLDSAYGGYSLVQMMNSDGGVNTLFERGPKREIFNKLCALIRGIEISKGE